METDEISEVPPSKLHRTEEHPNDQTDNLDPYDINIMDVGIYGTLLQEGCLSKFFETFAPPKGDALAKHKALLDLLIRLFNVTSAQNGILERKIEDSNEKLDVILQQNIKLINENEALRTQLNSLNERIQKLEKIQTRELPTPTSQHKFPQHNSSASYLAAASAGSVNSTSFQHYTSRNLFALQIHTVSAFQSCEELRLHLLRPMAFENNLPIIKNVSRTKQNDTFSEHKFKLIFTDQTDRSQWLSAINAYPQHFQVLQTCFGFRPKITFHGLPNSFSDMEHDAITNQIATSLQHDASQLQFLFKYKTGSSFKYVYSVHPDIRKTLWKANDRIKVQSEISEITDFIQPLQCKNCFTYGHSTKNCSINLSCRQCFSSNCPTPSNEKCTNAKCTNCMENHLPSERSKCPTYIKLINETTRNLQELKSQIS
jgi:hypothetical protein